MSKTPIALQLYSIREACGEDFGATLKAVKEMGYDGVEFAGTHGWEAEKLRDYLAELGLSIAGAHVGLPLLEGEKYAETVSYYKTLGCKNLVVPCVQVKEGGIAAWKAIGEKLNAIQAQLDAEGMRTGFHNHAAEFEALEDSTPFDALFTTMEPNLIMQVDAGWSFRAGVDARDLFKRYPKRSTTIHVKAYSSTNDTAVVGADDVPWKEVLASAVSDGACECFIVEHERHEGDPMANVKACLDYLRSIL